MGQSIFFRTDIFILYNFLYFQKISSTYWTTYRYSCDKCANEDPAGLQQNLHICSGQKTSIRGFLMLLIPLNHKRRVFIFLQDYVKTDLRRMYSNEWQIKFIKLID